MAEDAELGDHPGGTGDDRVDAVVDTLGQLDGRPLPEQVSHYDQVHASLHDILTTAEQG